MAGIGSGNLVPPRDRWHHHRWLRPAGVPYLPATILALALAVLGLWLTPMEWVRGFLFPGRAPEAADTVVDADAGALRIVELAGSDPPAPEIPRRATSPESTAPEPAPEAPASGRADEAFDPTTPYSLGRHELLRRPEPPTPLAAGSWKPEAWPTPTVADSLEHASLRNYTGWILRQHGPEWSEEMRRRRFEEWWTRYVMDDGL